MKSYLCKCFVDDVMLVYLCSLDGVSLVSVHSVDDVLLFYLCVVDEWVECSGR